MAARLLVAALRVDAGPFESGRVGAPVNSLPTATPLVARPRVGWGTSEFQSDASTNARVKARSELMVGALRGGEFQTPVRQGVFEALAEAARAEIPKR